MSLCASLQKHNSTRANLYIGIENKDWYCPAHPRNVQINKRTFWLTLRKSQSQTHRAKLLPLRTCLTITMSHRFCWEELVQNHCIWICNEFECLSTTPLCVLYISKVLTFYSNTNGNSFLNAQWYFSNYMQLLFYIRSHLLLFPKIFEIIE